MLRLSLRLPAARRAAAAAAMAAPAPPSPPSSGALDNLRFGPWPLHASEVFLSTPLSAAIVNMKPVVPGHVLVLPRRVAPRYADLTAEEATDLWLLAKRIGCKLENHHQATSLTFTIQDGPQAGQTVPHVHIHILPRRDGDFKKNDDVYDAVDESEKLMSESAEKLDLDKETKSRSVEDMAAEATTLARLFEST